MALKQFWDRLRNMSRNRKEERIEKEQLAAQIDGDLELRLIRLLAEREVALLHEIAGLLRAGKTATGLKILQIIGGSMQSDILGIVKGATGQFTVVPDPPGSVFPAGAVPVWSEDDTLVSQTVAPDGSADAIATTAADPATSFNLTVTVGSLAGTVSVPLTAPVAPPATGVNIKQIS